MTALIILNYNNYRDTINCLLSVDKYNSAPIKIIVVDNGSSPEEREKLKTAMKASYPGKLQILQSGQKTKANTLSEVTLILNETNCGYARGNNIALDYAFADPQIKRVMILNNDVLFVEDFIPELIRRQQQIKDCGLISPKLFKPGLVDSDVNCARRNIDVKSMIKENFLHYWWRFRGKDRKVALKDIYMLDQIDRSAKWAEIELPSGSCMMIDKDLIQAIGGFDPATFLYFEENILYKKLQRIGRKNYLCPDLRCVHLGAATTSKQPQSKFIVRCNVESQRYYVKNYSDESAFWKWIFALSSRWFWFSFKLQKSLQRR